MTRRGQARLPTLWLRRSSPEAAQLLHKLVCIMQTMEGLALLDSGPAGASPLPLQPGMQVTPMQPFLAVGFTAVSAQGSPEVA